MDFLIKKAKEILERAERIPYNPNWTLLEQNQLHAAKDLARGIVVSEEAKFKVHLMKQATLYRDVIVEAADRAAAEEQAIELAFGDGRWELSDDTGMPYVAEVVEVEGGTEE